MSGGVPSGGDRLAEYEDYAEAFLTGQTKRRMLALVEIAKAAREAAHPLTRDGYAAPFMYHPANEALRSALARLDSEEAK